MIIRDFSERSCLDKKEMVLAEFQQTRLESWNADDNENEKKKPSAISGISSKKLNPCL